MKSMITKDVINPAFLPPIKNLRTIHRVNPTTNEKNNGKKTSCNGISWILYWNKNKTGNSENRNGWTNKFFSMPPYF